MHRRQTRSSTLSISKTVKSVWMRFVPWRKNSERHWCVSLSMKKGWQKRPQTKCASRIGFMICASIVTVSIRVILMFDMLTFTVGSGDVEYRDAAIQTVEAIRQLHAKYPDVGSTLGLSNISFGLSASSRTVYLNSVFLHHCIEAGMTSRHHQRQTHRPSVQNVR